MAAGALPSQRRGLGGGYGMLGVLGARRLGVLDRRRVLLARRPGLAFLLQNAEAFRVLSGS